MREKRLLTSRLIRTKSTVVTQTLRTWKQRCMLKSWGSDWGINGYTFSSSSRSQQMSNREQRPCRLGYLTEQTVPAHVPYKSQPVKFAFYVIFK